MIARIIACVLLMLISGNSASAQGRHDSDQRWIRQTIHKQHRDAWFDARRHVRTYHSRRQSRNSSDRHPSTRVYGIIMRGPQLVQRDATSHIQCWPAIEDRSHERSSPDDAWEDAKRAWANQVRWKYGERFMSVDNAVLVERICNVSSISESVVGKATEAVRETFGGSGGGRWRCEIRASPCIAPTTSLTAPR